MKTVLFCEIMYIIIITWSKLDKSRYTQDGQGTAKTSVNDLHEHPAKPKCRHIYKNRDIRQNEVPCTVAWFRLIYPTGEEHKDGSCSCSGRNNSKKLSVRNIDLIRKGLEILPYMYVDLRGLDVRK